MAVKTAQTGPLSAPECRYGYPEYQLEREMTVLQLKEFYKFMVGQTFSSCDGREYDYRVKRYVPTDCGPHGWVFYTTDVERFLQGLPVID